MSLEPGLNFGLVAGALPSQKLKADSVISSISEHFSLYGGFVTWSGGRDSTVVTSLAHQAVKNIPVVWYDSGLEYPETREYIEKLASDLNFNLHVVKAEPDALTILKETGVWDHAAVLSKEVSRIHEKLIVDPAEKAYKMFGLGELTGLRAEESVGRRVLLAKDDGHYVRGNGVHVFAPIWAWKGVNVRAALASQGIPENPVYGKLEALGASERSQRVGLVVDGNNPQHGRYTYLRLGWPDLWFELCQVLPRLSEWR